MPSFNMLLLILVSLTISTFSLLSLRKVALAFGLVDKPDVRKRHQGDVPFIGGISLFITLTAVSLISPELIPNRDYFLVCGLFLTCIGTLDDKLDINAKTRLVLLCAISVCLVLTKNISLTNLGNLFGEGDVVISYGDTLLTTAAVIGCISAFNMVDGIDGLLGALASVAFGALAFLFYSAGNTQLTIFCIIFITSLFPYILFNLDLIPKRSFKVFMGDSGSFLIGFTIIWLIIHSSQKVDGGALVPIMEPVTALWIIALPLMDMVIVMMRRIRKGKSPLKPDRLHLHHICTRLGLSFRQTLMLLFTVSSCLALFGVWGQMSDKPESIMFLLFLSAFLIYILIMNNIWRFTVFARKAKTKISTSSTIS